MKVRDKLGNVFKLFYRINAAGYDEMVLQTKQGEKVIAEQGAWGSEWLGWHKDGKDWCNLGDVLDSYDMEIV